jgi:1-acyl-sn-glycerol-3-phosphate acyltransferase
MKRPFLISEMTGFQKFVTIIYSVYFQVYKFFWSIFATIIVNAVCWPFYFFPERIRRPFNYFCGNLWARGIFYGSFLRYRLTIDPQVDFSKTYLFAGNHSSSLDIYLWQTAIPIFFNWVAKISLFNIPILGQAMWALRHVPVYRDDDPTKGLKSVRVAVDRLKSGVSVAIFPEATRTRTGHLLPFKKGAFVIAKAGKVPIVPIVMKNGFYVAPAKRFLFNPFLRLEIKLLSPMDSSDKDIKQKLYDRIENELENS